MVSSKFSDESQSQLKPHTHLNVDNMQFQQDLSENLSNGNVRVDQQINLPDNVRLFEFYKNNQKMSNIMFNKENRRSNYFYIKQYFERFLQNEL